MLKTPVLVLHRYAYSESSFVVKTLSPETGVTSFLVKGAKRKESPFRIALDPMSSAEVVFQPSLRRELQIPREAVLLRHHDKMRADLESQAMAQVMCEVILRMTQAEGHFRDEYELLGDCFLYLDGESHLTLAPLNSIPRPFTLAFFLFELTHRLGFSFRLEHCIECGKPTPEGPVDLWPAIGGGVCASCLGTRRPSWTPAFIAQLHAFSGLTPRCIASPSPLELFFLQYLRLHTGLPMHIRSHAWLETLRNLT